jgi:hypothetical protein
MENYCEIIFVKPANTESKKETNEITVNPKVKSKTKAKKRQKFRSLAKSQ